MKLQPDLARQAIEALYSLCLGQTPAPVYIEVRGKREADSGITFNRFYDAINLLIEDMAQWQPDLNYWVGVALRKNDKGGKKADCAALTALFGDVDYGQVGHKKKNKWQTKEEALAAIEAFPQRPSLLIHSGGGFQSYWLLSEPFGIENGNYTQVEAIIKGLTLALGGDVGTQDVSRILRLPGTFNQKIADNPRPVEIVWCEPDRVYGLGDFAEYEGRPRSTSFAATRALTTNATNLTNINLPIWAKNLIQTGDQGGYPSRSERDYAVIGALFRSGCNLDIIEAIYQGYPVGDKYRERGDYGRAYLQTSFNKALAAAPRRITAKVGISDAINLTDMGNALRLFERHGQNIRYCELWKKWLIWDSKRWAKDNTLKIMLMAKDTVKGIYSEAEATNDDKERIEIAKHATRSENENRLKAMIALARSELSMLPEQFDEDLWLFNCLNGTLDLKTGAMQPHSREDYLTKLSSLMYDPHAECPRWIEFLETITNQNYKLIAFLQRAVGYSLSGDTREQVMFFIYGVRGQATFQLRINHFLDFSPGDPIYGGSIEKCQMIFQN